MCFINININIKKLLGSVVRNSDLAFIVLLSNLIVLSIIATGIAIINIGYMYFSLFVDLDNG